VAVKGPIFFLFALLVTGFVFTAAPGIDLWAARLFWSPDGGFFLADWPPFHWAYKLLPTLTWAIVLGLLALLAFVILAERPVWRLDRKMILYLLLSFALGPGLIANTVLKDHWGRARPSQVVELGGTKHFTAAIVPSGQCDRNCSFVSGHGAMAFSLIAFAALPATLRRRRQVAAAALAFGAFVGLARMAQGGHFLSDTIFAGFLVTATAWLLYQLIVVQDWLSHSIARQLWTGCGRALGALGDFVLRSSSSPPRRWLAFHLASAIAVAVSILWIDRPLAVYFHAGDDRLSAFFAWGAQFGLGWGWLVASGGATALLLALARAPRFAAARERFTAWARVPGFIFASVAIAGLLADILKIIVGRTRPKLLFSDGLFAWDGPAWRADHWSFPSGHTVNVAALAAALYLLWPRHIAAYALLVAFIALCRVGADQHYLSDTIGSAWLGIVMANYLYGVFERSGIPLEDAKAGVIPPLAPEPWRRRLAPYRHSP